MLPTIELDESAATPLYRQLFDQIRVAIAAGTLEHGERLPATRELAGLLGLNRTTVSAAYELLETEGLIRGHVGRGSFVNGPVNAAPAGGLDWSGLLPSAEANSAPPGIAADGISFAASRPSELLFPVDEFREASREVIEDESAAVLLQLGASNGYGPLRRYLLDESTREGAARISDDILITNGCQQALDLLQRLLVHDGDTVVLEDPVYSGMRNVFQRANARLIGVPVTAAGIDLEILGRVLLKERPRLLVVTPNFQNPTGATLPLSARQAILRLVRQTSTILVENDLYGNLRYSGDPLPTIKQLDDTGDTVLLRSFSKVAFPGLRVGWAIGPHALIARLTEAKQWCDLHTDQLSQAILLRFAESGRLEAHRQRMLTAGRERLAAALDGCARHLPAGSRFTRPQGGMNVWVHLPEPLDAGELLPRAQREHVTYLPGRYFAVSRSEPGGLRLSFAGLAPDRIGAGLAILGDVFSKELARVRARSSSEPEPAMV